MPPYIITRSLDYRPPAAAPIPQETLALEGVDSETVDQGSAFCPRTGELCPGLLDLAIRYTGIESTNEVPQVVNPALNGMKFLTKRREYQRRSKKENCYGPQDRQGIQLDEMSGYPFDLKEGSRAYIAAKECPIRENMNKDLKRQEAVIAYRGVAGAIRLISSPFRTHFKKDAGTTENS